ncbi:MAG: hypothetical protein QMD46_03155 [Methanomicrobiales archaeon]|nr:hypothetical protein [Methanomicrobiales archaeon]MDI6876074.1 hypothetical protein [Methanomicrobiales archaeon]
MLPVASLTAHLSFTTPVDLPFWMGSTFRGGLGIHLRKACCPDLQEDCYHCAGREDCIFYHTHMRRTSRRGRAPPPKPVVIIPPFFGREMHFDKDCTLDLNILLLGKFLRYLPHVVLGLRLLGQSGIGSTRHYGNGRFRIDGITCNFSAREIFKDGSLDMKALQTCDIRQIPHAPVGSPVRVGFRTPFIAKTGEFPPAPDRLLWHIRQRIIYNVNEYGDGGELPDFSVSGSILSTTKHFHRLVRASSRTGMGSFYGFTGVVDYAIDNGDGEAEWLFAVGSIIGAGPKASFGCGHLQIGSPQTVKEESEVTEAASATATDAPVRKSPREVSLMRG